MCVAVLTNELRIFSLTRILAHCTSSNDRRACRRARLSTSFRFRRIPLTLRPWLLRRRNAPGWDARRIADCQLRIADFAPLFDERFRRTCSTLKKATATALVERTEMAFPKPEVAMI